MKKHKGFIAGSFPLYYLAYEMGVPWKTSKNLNMETFQGNHNNFREIKTPGDIDVFIPVFNMNFEEIDKIIKNKNDYKEEFKKLNIFKYILKDFDIEIVEYVQYFQEHNMTITSKSFFNRTVYKLGKVKNQIHNIRIMVHVYRAEEYKTSIDFTNTFDFTICSVIWDPINHFKNNCELVLNHVKNKIFWVRPFSNTFSWRFEKYIERGYKLIPYVHKLYDILMISIYYNFEEQVLKYILKNEKQTEYSPTKKGYQKYIFENLKRSYHKYYEKYISKIKKDFEEKLTDYDGYYLFSKCLKVIENERISKEFLKI